MQTGLSIATEKMVVETPRRALEALLLFLRRSETHRTGPGASSSRPQVCRTRRTAMPVIVPWRHCGTSRETRPTPSSWSWTSLGRDLGASAGSAPAVRESAARKARSLTALRFYSSEFVVGASGGASEKLDRDPRGRSTKTWPDSVLRSSRLGPHGIWRRLEVGGAKPSRSCRGHERHARHTKWRRGSQRRLKQPCVVAHVCTHSISSKMQRCQN